MFLCNFAPKSITITMKHLWTIIFLFFSLSCCKTFAENGRLYTSEYLSSSAVTNICQDKFGFIWVGTECGLNKFDGYHFTHFISQANDTTTISDSNISAIYVDSQGRLWIGGDTGLSRYDYHTNSFKRYVFPDNIQPRVSSFEENPQGLLIGTAGYGLFSIRNGTDCIHHDMQQLYNTSGCTALTEADNGDIYIGTNNGLHRYSYKTNTVELVDESRPLEGHDISCLYVEKNGDVWMGTTNGICTEKRIIVRHQIKLKKYEENMYYGSVHDTSCRHCHSRRRLCPMA